MSKARVDAKTHYSQVEQTALALKSVAQKLRSYFKAHQVTILTNQTLQVTLHKSDLSWQMLKWAIELSEYEIKYQSQLSLKGQVKVDFIVELLKKQTYLVNCLGEQWWILYVDGASRVSGSGVGLLLQSPTGKIVEQDICLSFSASNNEIEYEVVLVGLDLALILATTKQEIKSGSQLIIEQIHREYEANDERMMRYLAIVEECLKKLDEWITKRVSWEENGKVNTLARIVAILPINWTVMLSIYLKVASSITLEPYAISVKQTQYGCLTS